MRHVSTTIDIDAPPEAVWESLADLDSYAEWNPHITSASGTPREGERVSLTIVPGGRRPRTVRATVTAADAPRHLQWVGVGGSRWLFEGRHTFDLEPLAGGRTRLTNREELSGALVPLVVRPDAHRDYEAMNEALAARVSDRIGPAADSHDRGTGRA